MRVGIDCYGCIINQLAGLVRQAEPTVEGQRALMREFLKQVLAADEETTPPEFAACFHREVRRRTGVADPFRREKDRSTELALALLPELTAELARRGDDFVSLLKLVIGGNIIDFGVDPKFDLARAEARIREVFELPLDLTAAARLEAALDRAQSVFYMLDNCGEAVFDRLLIDRYRDKITVGVRGGPILNDVTRRELEPSGIRGVRVVDTGDDAPGVSLRRSSPEFVRALTSAELVVAKGQGNYESLDRYERPIFFLLRVKCPVVARVLNEPLGALKIAGRNL